MPDCGARVAHRPRGGNAAGGVAERGRMWPARSA